MAAKKKLTETEKKNFIELLKDRFEKNTSRHKGVGWESVLKKLEANETKLFSLYQMESTGGEPDVVTFNNTGNSITFVDCAVESPAGRRSLCYDREGQKSRKEHQPENNALDMAEEMKVDLLTEAQYRELQKTGKYDLKTSSWIKTPDGIRKLGGALFCDRRYDHVFVYHNGAQSYYAARGFRALISF